MVKDKSIKCSSCNVDLTNMTGSVEFDCPNCGKVKIIRCGDCRTKAIKYKCSECGFEGPN
jgi:Zn-ribbon RNA-binding protein